ncbi:ankyrin repeat-containing domain protein [Phaeosphaeriaceae sp. PMI808]|nr:ankyrin repeat-containing domain protein [Phaeosphaeriaceae sp. PMI808]
MSGAEAGQVVGLISSLIAVLNIIGKLYSGVKDAEDIPITFREIARPLLVVQDTLRVAQALINTRGLDEESCSEIKPTMERCKDKALRLETVFRKVTPQASISRHDRYRLAANAFGKESRVETLTKEMLEDVKLLAENPIVKAETEAEVRKLVRAIEELSMLPPPLLEDAPRHPINNYGSGTVNANTGSGTANNNTSSGRQYNGQNQYFGDLSKVLDPAKLLAEEQKRCSVSLSFATIDARRQDIASAHQDTCKWIFQTPQFRQWWHRDDLQSHNGVLWIKGKPGAGKSTLMKYTLQHCREFFEDHITVAYFFNARGDSLEKTPLGMLRSMTYQLLEQDLLYERFLPRFRDKEKKHEKWKWREAELKDFLLSEIKTPQSKPLLFHIDALDECRESDVREVVEFLEELSINAVEANVTLNICLSSRHYPTISMKKRLEVVVEEKKEHNDDIARYVHDKLKKQDEDIEKEVLEKAAGVFMWVVLVVAMLNRAYDEGKVDAMQQKLDESPGDLEKVFETLLSEDNPDKHETIYLLQWVLFARRALKPEELYFAMMAGTSVENLRAWDRSKITSEDIRRRITSSSKGLIEIRKGKDRTVQFIHESVNDFVLRNGRLQTLDLALNSNPIGTSHDSLRACCMSYLRMGELLVTSELPQADEISSMYPFLEYASTYVLNHAEEAQGRGVMQKELLHWLQRYEDFERLRSFHNAFERVPGLGCSKGVTPVHTLSLHGYHELVNSILSESGVDVNAQGGPYSSALQAAAVKGKEEIVRILVEKGADVNTQGGVFGSALQAAAAEGKEKIVKMLLEKGADVNTQGGVFSSALQAAALQGKEEIVRILVEKGADVNTQGGVFGSALQAAAADSNEEIVKMLLEKGADVNAQGGVFSSALQAAAYKDEEEIVRMLVEKEADVNAQGGPYGSVLQAAAVKGKEEIVKMLLKNGADVNAQGGLYGSALQAAAAKGKEEIVKMLLEKGADVNAQDGVFGSALQAAAANGNGEIVGILLEEGADINTQGRLYGSALQVAVFEGNGEIVRILVEKGADVNTLGRVFSSALQAAAFQDKEEIVRILLEKGADVNAQGGPYSSTLQVAALQAAAASGNKEIVRILLEKGADVNAQGGLFGNALQAAAAKGKEEIVKMLLEKGADVNAQDGLFGSALQVAAAHGNREIVGILLGEGADVNAQGRLFGSALQAAATEGKEEIVGMLLAKGADVNAQGGFYSSALKARSCETHCRENNCYSDDTAKDLRPTQQHLGRLVLVVVTLLTILFMLRLPL